ncbi:MAG: hypothetical protein ACYDG2_21180, partial [Ruminiclostridium sp.]
VAQKFTSTWLKYSLTFTPDKFDFRLRDYNTDEGLDCLTEVDSDVFNKFNFNQRFGNLLEKIKGGVDTTESEIETDSEGEMLENQDEEKICFSELKLKLTDNMNHSLALVSHIICWSKPNFDGIKADDDLYGFTDSSKTILINSNAEMIKKVKVIYLKDMIENITGGKFKK